MVLRGYTAMRSKITPSSVVSGLTHASTVNWRNKSPLACVFWELRDWKPSSVIITEPTPS